MDAGVSAAVRFDDRAAGRGQLRLVLLEAGAHLRRLADELRAKRRGVGAAGHLLLHGRTGRGRSLRNARDQDGQRESGGFQIVGLGVEGLGHGSTFGLGCV